VIKINASLWVSDTMPCIYFISKAQFKKKKTATRFQYISSGFFFNAEISDLQIWCIQDEEKNRNSVMLDLLYTHCAHPLSAQVFSYYQVASQLPPRERTCWVIDTNAR